MTAYRCTEKVWGRGSWGSHTCGKTARFDPVNGKPSRCGIHSSEAVAKRKAKQDAEMKKWRDRQDLAADIAAARGQLEIALRKIALGHNDPRGLAIETITALDAAVERARR